MNVTTVRSQRTRDMSINHGHQIRPHGPLEQYTDFVDLCTLQMKLPGAGLDVDVG